MPILLVGTRVEAAPICTADAADLLDVSTGSSIAIATAYWDELAKPIAIDLAWRVGGLARVALWAGGATSQEAVDALVENGTGDSRVEVRIVGSPESSGIFHAKVAGTIHDSGEWHSAIVGSENFITPRS
jgi:hypothetical protein